MRPVVGIRGGWRGLGLVSAVVVAVVSPGTVTAAEPPVTVENVRVGFNDHYKLGTWTPVTVDLKAGPQRFAGVMQVIVPDDDGTATVVSRQVDIPARQTLPFGTYVRPGTRDVEFQVRLADDRDRTIARGIGRRPYTQLDPDQKLVLSLGSPRGVDEILKLPGFTNESRPLSSPVVVLNVPVGSLPAAWYGYDAAETVVLDTNARDVMAALDTLRGEGLRQWVENGGHLVVAIGANWQEVNDSFLQKMLPAVPVGREAMVDLGAVESFVGSENKPINPDRQAVQVTKFDLVPARGAKALDSTAAGPILVRGHYGFGRVTVVGLDVDGKLFSDWALKNQFWAKLLELRPRADAAGASNPGGAYYNQYVGDLATLLHSNLEQFEGVQLVPFGWVAFFIFLYILLIGPGDYFFLKKVVKRMEYTWITFPLIVAAVSLLAYAGAYAVKGTDLRINKVDALDVNQADNLLRGTTWATIFSPQNRDYDVAIVPLNPSREPDSDGDAAAEPSTSQVLPTRSKILSWFGSPEEGIGGMGGSGRMSLSGASYRYAAGDNPFGAPEEIRGVRIPIWSTKSFTAQWYGPAVKVVEADLQSTGTDRLTGTITNELKVPLRDVCLIDGKYVYELRDLAPGETKSLAAVSEVSLTGYLDRLIEKIPKINRYQLGSQGFNLARGQAVRAILFDDVTIGRANAIGSEVLHDLDLTGQVALDRPMLLANVGGLSEREALALQAQGGSESTAKTTSDGSTTPAASPFPVVALDLGRSSTPPKLDQVTVLRVILPTPKGR